MKDFVKSEWYPMLAGLTTFIGTLVSPVFGVLILVGLVTLAMLAKLNDWNK